MIPIHIALSRMTRNVTDPELAEVAAALQKQVARDFGPIWGVTATVDAFAADRIPAGYWPIFVQDTLDDPTALGYHMTEVHKIPYALVLYGESWSLTASHECLEMLADPFGSRMRAGPSPRPDQGRVNFLMDVCDPCESPTFAYGVNGVAVSDFYTPQYFDPVVVPGGRYSFTGAIEQPLQVLRDGYLTWFALDGLAYQARADSEGSITFTDGIDPQQARGRPLREFIDSLVPEHQHRLSNARVSRELRDARANARVASAAHSTSIQSEIRRRYALTRETRA